MTRNGSSVTNHGFVTAQTASESHCHGVTPFRGYGEGTQAAASLPPFSLRECDSVTEGGKSALQSGLRASHPGRFRA